MSLGQLQDGRWYVQYEREGRTKREYFGRGPEAAQAASSRHDALGLRKWTSSKRTGGISFGELAQAYMNSGATRMQDSTFSRALSVLNANIIPAIGHRPADGLTPEIMDEYVLRRMRAVTGSTAHRECTAIRTIIRWGLKRRLIGLDPLAGWDLPRVTTSPAPPPTIDEVHLIWKHASRHVQRALALLWFIGVRGAGEELLSLRWDAVDWQAQTIQVASARKGGPRSRRVRLHPVLLELLRAWSGEDDCPWIVHRFGKRLKRISVAWRNACRSAGVRRIRPYDCRHAFATAAITGGADIKTVQLLLGHASASTTLGIYTHAVSAAADNAISLIPGNGFELLPRNEDKKEIE